MNQGIEQCRGCLEHLAFQVPKDGVQRVSLNPNVKDSDLLLSKQDNPYQLDQYKITSSKSVKRLGGGDTGFF